MRDIPNKPKYERRTFSPSGAASSMRSALAATSSNRPSSSARSATRAWAMPRTQVAGGLAELHDLCEVGLELGPPAERHQRVPAHSWSAAGDVDAGGELGPPRVLGVGRDGQGLVAQAEPVRGAGKTQGGRDQPAADRGGDLGRARLDVGEQPVRRLDVVGEAGVGLERSGARRVTRRRGRAAVSPRGRGAGALPRTARSPPDRFTPAPRSSRAMAMRSMRAPERSRRAASIADPSQAASVLREGVVAFGERGGDIEPGGLVDGLDGLDDRQRSFQHRDGAAVIGLVGRGRQRPRSPIGPRRRCRRAPRPR